MGPLALLMDLVNVAKVAESFGVNADNAKEAAKAFQKAKSISSQANKYVLQYPVACTSSVSDMKTAIAITKQVEFDCARFVILASGLNPVIDAKNKDTIATHINSLITAYESFSGIPISINAATEEDIKNAQIVLDKRSLEEYKPWKSSESIKNSIFSQEIVSVDTDNEPGDNPSTPSIDHDREYDIALNDYYMELAEKALSKQRKTHDNNNDSTTINFEDIVPEPSLSSINYYERMTNYRKAKDYYDNGIKNMAAQLKYNDGTFATNATGIKDYANIIGKMGKLQPTIISLSLILADGHGGQKDITFPLAIKSTLQFIDSDEIEHLLSQVDNPARKLQNFIKVTTGEMSFFRDWLFAIDEANKDVEREKIMENVPIYRRLINSKNRNRFKRLKHIPVLKKFIARTNQKDLPMCTVIVTVKELEDVTHKRIENLVKDRKFIDQVLDTYMMLGLGVVDEMRDVIYFFYSGEEDVVTVDINKIGGTKKDIEERLSEALLTMTKLMNRR